ncbi:MAG: succinylglutamate desuccinylase/aspartoacylase family protein [bacterium]|nr:succinylglutamate desuccinylase/aspartoacylase family protein [bacterium]
MKPHLLGLWLVLFALGSAGCSDIRREFWSLVHEADLHDVSKFKGERRDYELIKAKVQQLSPKGSPIASDDLGQVPVGDGSTYPLYVLHYRPPKPTAQPLRILVSGSVHGDEPAGTAAIFRLAEQLLADLPEDLEVWMFPVAAPRAYVKDSRFTEPINGQKKANLNRDFLIDLPEYEEAKGERDETGQLIHATRESTLFTRYLIDLKVQVKSFDLHLDFHECSICQAGMLFTNDLSQGKMLDAMYPPLKPKPGEKPFPLKQYDFLVDYLKTYKDQLYFVDPFKGPPVFSRWTFVKLGVPSFTTETGQGRSLNDRAQLQLAILNHAVNYLRTQRAQPSGSN